MLKDGEEMTVRGYLAKDGTKLRFAQNVMLADGRMIGLGSAPGPRKGRHSAMDFRRLGSTGALAGVGCAIGYRCLERD
jgi:hypothetical protein